VREFCGEEARECRRRPDFIGDFAGCISGRPINLDSVSLKGV